MTCCAQVKNIGEALKYLGYHQPDDYAKLAAMDQAQLAAMVQATAQQMVNADEGDTEPTFKPHPFGACYLIADFNYAQAVTTCNIITDPVVRDECLAKARKIYCEALDLCGDPV